MSESGRSRSLVSQPHKNVKKIDGRSNMVMTAATNGMVTFSLRTIEPVVDGQEDPSQLGGPRNWGLVISQIRQSSKPPSVGQCSYCQQPVECTSQIPRGLLLVACTAKSCFPAKDHGCGKKNAGCPMPCLPNAGVSRWRIYSTVGKPSSLVSSPLLPILSVIVPHPDPRA